MMIRLRQIFIHQVYDSQLEEMIRASIIMTFAVKSATPGTLRLLYCILLVRASTSFLENTALNRLMATFLYQLIWELAERTPDDQTLGNITAP